MSVLSTIKAGVNILTGFKLHAPQPLDLRQNVQTIEERDRLVSDNIAFKGLRVFVNNNEKSYIYNGKTWDEIPKTLNMVDSLPDFTGTTGDNIGTKGLVPAPGHDDEGKVLGSNGQWVDIPIVGEDTNGLMTTEMLNKVNGIEEGANNYTHPDTHPATMIDEDEDHRFVSDSEKEYWNNKAEFVMSENEPSKLSANGIYGAIIGEVVSNNHARSIIRK